MCNEYIKLFFYFPIGLLYDLLNCGLFFWSLDPVIVDDLSTFDPKTTKTWGSYFSSLLHYILIPYAKAPDTRHDLDASYSVYLEWRIIEVIKYMIYHLFKNISFEASTLSFLIIITLFSFSMFQVDDSKDIQNTNITDHARLCINFFTHVITSTTVLVLIGGCLATLFLNEYLLDIYSVYIERILITIERMYHNPEEYSKIFLYENRPHVGNILVFITMILTFYDKYIKPVQFTINFIRFMFQFIKCNKKLELIRFKFIDLVIASSFTEFRLLHTKYYFNHTKAFFCDLFSQNKKSEEIRKTLGPYPYKESIYLSSLYLSSLFIATCSSFKWKDPDNPKYTNLIHRISYILYNILYHVFIAIRFISIFLFSYYRTTLGTCGTVIVISVLCTFYTKAEIYLSRFIRFSMYYLHLFILEFLIKKVLYGFTKLVLDIVFANRYTFRLTVLLISIITIIKLLS